MIILVISIIAFATFYVGYFLLKGNRANAQTVSRPAAHKPYNGPELTEEEFAVIAAAIKAFESEAFEITSINEVVAVKDPKEEKAELPKFYQKSSGLWVQTARREYQRRL